jgi:PAS domain S-box-containing protein
VSQRRVFAVLCVCVVLALGLGARVPLQFAIPLAAVAVLAAAFWLQRDAVRRYASFVARVEAIQGVRTGETRLAPWADPTQLHDALTREVAANLEESYFRLIRTNIQLLSLKEVGRSIIASLDRERTVQSVLEYMQRGIGFEQFGLFVWSPEEGVFEGSVRQGTGSDPAWVPQRFALPETEGILAKALGRQRSYLIKDAVAHPLGRLHGEDLFALAGSGSYVVVPLTSNTPPGPVWERRGCDRDTCPCATPGSDWVEKFAGEPDESYWDGGRFRCWSCSGFSLLGVLVATDSGRNAALSKIDLIMLETLAQNLATVLENARLYEDVKREERFREHVLASMSNGLVSVDLVGRVQLFNQAAEKLSGYPVAAVRGRLSGEIISRAGAHGDPLREALEAGSTARAMEAVLHGTAPQPMPIRLTTSLLRDENGAVQGVLGEFADLSAIKRMEAQIRHLDKLAALGRFTSSVAHEIRNPLAGITAGIHYLRKRMDPASQEHAEFILAEVDRLNRIIEDLFRVGRPLELSLQETDLEELLERSVRTLEPRAAEHSVQCVRRVAAGLPPVAVDADRIEQVLINLIQNAIDASPAGASVDIEMQLGSSAEPLAASPPANPDALVIAVRDRGAGIEEENRDKIFEPFFTTKARGTGLGLYVCHHIIEGHGGSIGVDTACGQGARFVVSLPLGRIRMGGYSETADLARR